MKTLLDLDASIIEHLLKNLDQSSILAVTDPLGILTYVNRKFCEISGFSQDELVGNSHRIVNSGYHPADFFAQMWATISAGKVWHGEVRNRSKTGSFYWVDTTIYPIKGTDSLPRAFLAVRRDITEQMTKEIGYNYLTQDNYALLSSSKVCIFATDISGVIQLFSLGSELMFGWAAEEIVHKKTPMLLHDFEEVKAHAKDLSKEFERNIDPGFESLVAKVIKDGSEERPWILTRKDGQKLRVLLTLSQLKDDSGRMIGFVGVGIEVTKLVRAGEEFRNFVFNMPAAVFRMTGNGDYRFQYISKAIEGITSHSVTEFQGQSVDSFFRLIQGVQKSHVIMALQQCAIDSSIQESNFSILDKIGNTRWLKMKICSASNPDGDHVFIDGVVIDVTEEKRSSEALELERLKSLQAGRLATVGQLSAGLSHEINNPLTVVFGKAEAIRYRLKKEGFENATVTRDIDRIVETAQRIVKIVAGIKRLSRDEQGDKPIQYSVQQLIAESLEYINDRANSECTEIKTGEGLTKDLVVSIRPTQIFQVMLNLLINSLDAVNILPVKWVEIRAALRGDIVEIRITDSGPGIEKSIVDKMMDPFFTTKEVGKGTGLGLSICKGIIEDHGGRFFYDAKTSNTSFVVHLPTREGAILLPLDVDDAIESHSAWRQKLIKYVQSKDKSLSPETVGSDIHCALGKWILHVEGKYGQLDEFAALRRSHREFHTAAAAIVSRVNAGQSVAISELSTETSPYVICSGNVVKALFSLKHKIEV